MRRAGGGDSGGWKDIVHAAGAVALGIEGYVEEAEGAEGGGDSIEGFERQGAGKLFAGDFNTGKFAVVAHTNLLKAKGMEGFFGLFDLREIFAGNRAAVLDARGETGGGGLVPELKANLMGELANLGFGEFGGDQRSDGVMLGRGLLAGAEFAAVIEVHAEGDVAEAAGLTLGLHASEELIFAVKAALAVVALVVGVLEFFGVQNLDGNIMLGGEVECGGQFGAG